MVASIGNFALIIALILSLLQSYPRFYYIGISSFFIFMLTLAAFGALMLSYVLSDFSVLNVYYNSHSMKPMLYKITGTWGNHEGSMLLLSLILSIYNFAFINFSTTDNTIKSPVARVQSLINFAFLLFLVLTSNPFITNDQLFAEGLGLNPLLQDIGLAIHPPILYIGYIGVSFGFSFSLVALMQGKINKQWTKTLRHWITISWSFLTLGIGLGSWWAYRELGWGGFWFWDPVENTSLMPWLCATALMHSLIVVEKREALKIWSVLLGLLTFIFGLVGIFLVRSGILTSVHSFANDPERGVFILIFLTLVSIISLSTFALRAYKLSPKNYFMPISKEGFILINNILLCILCFTILLGTLYPIILESLSNTQITVAAPYFNTTFIPIALLLLVFAAYAPSLMWQRHTISAIKTKFSSASILNFPLLATITIITPLIVVSKAIPIISAIAIACGVWLITMTISALIKQHKKSGIVSLSFYAMVIAHIGLGFLVIGITYSTSLDQEEERIIKINESIPISKYNIKLKQMLMGAKDNYLTRIGEFELLHKDGKRITTLKPEIRYYPATKTNTTESAIHHSISYDLYIVMGDSTPDGGFVVRIYYKPFIQFIWLGCLMMFLGGMLAWINKRYNK